MQQTTWFNAMTKALQRHSEFMQPELGEGYPDMEYGFPDFPSGRNLVPTDQQGSELYPAGRCVLTCFAPLYCDEDVQCHFNISQGEPRGIPSQMTVTDLDTKKRLSGDRLSMPVHQTDSQLDAIYRQSRGDYAAPPTISVEQQKRGQRADYLTRKTTGSSIFPMTIAPPPGGWPHWPEEPSTRLKVCAQDQAGNVCCTKLSVFCRMEDCCQRSDYVAMTFDDGSTPDTIAPGASITVYVADGCGPYNWSVSGQGYSFAAAQTSGGTNALSLVNGTCGTGAGQAAVQGFVSVTDYCGTTVTAAIKSTAGGWQDDGYAYVRCGSDCGTGCSAFACVGLSCTGTAHGPTRQDSPTVLYSWKQLTTEYT